jgi:hypothetical protein
MGQEMWAFHTAGHWRSRDGRAWERSPLPTSGLNPGYQKYVRFGDAWGGSPVVFDDRLWLVGANRNSTFAPSTPVTEDVATWHEEAAPWSPRGAPAVWVFGNKRYMTGGKYSVMHNGVPQFIDRNDVWSLARRP